MKNYDELIGVIHQMAVDHGWWIKKRTEKELLLLIQSEILESFEEYRNNRGLNETYYSGKITDKNATPVDTHVYESALPGEFQTAFGLVKVEKPEGIPSEMADILIRCLDVCGQFSFSVSWFSVDKTKKMFLNDFEPEGASFCDSLFDLSSLASQYEALDIDWALNIDGATEPFSLVIHNIISMVLAICEKFDIDIDSAIPEKIEYNETRPFLHGGKKL